MKNQPNIIMIAAMDQNRVIGADNQMPWHLPDDLKFFKQKTLGKPVIMGRKTYESIGAKPLPGRRNLVITRNASYELNGAEGFSSVEAALETCEGESDVVIMGGGQLYQQCLPFAQRLYVTLVHTEVEGDTSFPEWKSTQWKEVEREHHSQDEKHAFSFEFITLDRV